MVKDVMMDSFKDEESFPCNRNMKLLKIAEDGSGDHDLRCSGHEHVRRHRVEPEEPLF